MAQFKTGTVDVVNGSPNVTGVGTDWVGNISAGDAFNVVGDDVLYDVSSVTSNTEIQLTAPYGGATATGVNYSITRDFTSPDNIPELNRGALATSAIYTRAVRKIQELFNGLGTAATKDVTTSSTDATGGRLLKVGDFGLGIGGNAITLADIDDPITPAGLYRTADNGTLGTFPQGASKFGMVFVEAWRTSDGNISQKYHTPGNTSSSGRLWFRSHNSVSTTWNPWVELYTTGNILGAVSQSGGVPTGAGFEWTDTSNGKFYKSAGNLLVCTHAMKAEYLNSSTLLASWSFPAAFASADAYSWSASIQDRDPNNTIDRPVSDADLNGSVILENSHSNTTLNVFIKNTAAPFVSTDYVWVSLMAEGNWYV